MKTRTTKAITALLTILLTTCLNAGAQFIYDFENLVDGPLAGQDNWQNRSASPFTTTDGIATTGTGVNTSRIMGSSAASGIGSLVSRINNNTYGYSLSGLETAAVFQFDARLGTGQGMAQMGFGSNFDDTSPPDEYGFAFGFEGTIPVITWAAASSGFQVMTGNAPFNYGSGDWVTVRLTVDFTANGGNGSGSFSAMNLTDGETEFTPIFKTSLVLLAMPVNARPAFWNGVYAEIGPGAGIDNLTAPNAVPEPSAFALFGLPAVLLIVGRFRKV